MILVKNVESIKELRHLCMKYDRDGRPMLEEVKGGIMAYFYPVQTYITKLLLTCGFSSLQATILWCGIGLIASGLFCFGTFTTTFVALLLIYLQIALDGCDGEIARYHKRFLSKEKDFELFSKGIYVDECCHAILNPAMFMGFACGIFLQTGWIGFIVCGIVMSYLILFRMISNFAIPHIVTQLVDKLPDSMDTFLNEVSIPSNNKRSLFERVHTSLFLRYRNGKMVLFTLTVLTTLDFICAIITNEEHFIIARSTYVIIGPFIMIIGTLFEMKKERNWVTVCNEIMNIRKRCT